MANPFRGKVTLKAGDEQYEVSFSINAVCEIEEHFGKPIAEVGKMMQAGDAFEMKTLRFVLWAGLQDNHDDLTIKDAGNIASNAGIEECGVAISKAFELAFPQPKAGGAKGNSRPRNAARG